MADTLTEVTTIQDNLTAVSLPRVSTAQEFKAAADARRRAAGALGSIPTDTIAKIAEAQRKQVAALTPVFGPVRLQIFEELRRTMAMYDSIFKNITLPYVQLNQAVTAWQSLLAGSMITELQLSAVQSIRLSINFESPRIYMPQRLEEATVQDAPVNEPDEIMQLAVSIDQFGNFILGDRKIYRANVNTSQHGKMLQLLETHKDELLTDDELKAHFKTGSTRDIMKNLKKDLRELGYRLDYEAYRRQGLLYHGVLRRQ